MAFELGSKAIFRPTFAPKLQLDAQVSQLLFLLHWYNICVKNLSSSL